MNHLFISSSSYIEKYSSWARALKKSYKIEARIDKFVCMNNFYNIFQKLFVLAHINITFSMLSLKIFLFEDIEHFLWVLNDNYAEWTLIIEQINYYFNQFF